MIFKQFYLESLGQASYLVGSEQIGEALVLDPRRDVDPYYNEARAHGLRIRYGIDTHQHNDYLSGISELSARGEIETLASSEAMLKYPNRPLSEGTKLEMGEILFETLHTPGHTPEHISLLITDRSRGEEPTLLLSGGSLLVGDIARPDLLGGEQHTTALAKSFYRTLKEKILTLPDFVEVYPTHVAGSLCGGRIGSRLSTTIGYERRMNKALRGLDSIEKFVAQTIDTQNLPSVPPYWPRMRKLNQEGPPVLGILKEPPALRVSEFQSLRKKGAVVLDCRSPEAFAVHIPGAQNVGYSSSFTVWAGSVLSPDQETILVLEKPAELWGVCWELLRIGFNLPIGWLSGGMMAWRTSGENLEILPQWTVGELKENAERDHELVVLDVRQPREYNGGHIKRSQHLSGALLQKKSQEIPKGKRIAVICGSGYRSSIAASFLKRQGYREVINVIGGMSAWENAGFELVK